MPFIIHPQQQAPSNGNMPTQTSFGRDLTAADSPPTSAAKPSSALKSSIRDENKPCKTSASSLLNLSPSRGDKKRRKKPRVTESLSPIALSQETSSTAGRKSGDKSTSPVLSPSKSLNRGNANDNSLGRKRKAVHFSDTENNAPEGNERKWERGVRGKKKCFGSSFLDDESEASSESDDEAGTFASKKHAARKRLTYESLSSDDSGEEEEMVAKRSVTRLAKSTGMKKNRSGMSADSDEEDNNASSRADRPRSKNDGWLTSYHASTRDDDESSTDPEDEDETFDLGIRFNWWTGPRRDEKLDHLHSEITNYTDKALQLLLWDIHFDYNIHPHQFEAIRFVAGFVPSFPLEHQANKDDEALQEMLRLDETGRYYRTAALDEKKLRLPGSGMILADEMGLGKTIEALGGAALRNYAVKSTKKKKPTLIVTPADGVQHQWVTSLARAGVEPARITIIGEKISDTKARGGNAKKNKKVQGGEFIICTRYKIQSELKRLFDYSSTAASQTNKPKSILFQKIPLKLIKDLRRQYRIDQGAERAPHYVKNEPKPDRVTKIVGRNNLPKVFESVIIDECHFLRNILAYWGMGAALLGSQSKRTILLSGTPYNNGNSDMSALMTFIDPRHEASLVNWWDKATSRRKASDVIAAVSDWKSTFMLRRQKDVLGNKLPSRERCVISVPYLPSEVGVYEYYEAVFLKALNQLQEEIGDSNRKKQKEMVEIMMACMACMRMSLIHPILPKGREVTIQFSPSRKHLLKREEQDNKKRCVLCGSKTPTENAEKFEAMKASDEHENEEPTFRELLGMDTRARNDEDLMNDDDEPRASVKDEMEDEEKGRIVEIGPDICRASGSDCCHFAHERCLELFKENGYEDCPRCQDFATRLYNAGNKVYCQNIEATVSNQGGFAASAKIEKAISWFKGVPADEKVIILSFYKSSLDLLEGILVYEYGIQCRRYDGDVAKEKRAVDLDYFKTNRECKVLLASVQSGGVGLNIVQANNVLFLDRWYNPQIHDQAESRCHRLGQKKDVKIAYLDTCYTADVVMKHVNTLKEGNAAVMLAGTSLGQRFSMNYNELAGVIGDTLKSIIAMRHAAVIQNGENGDAGAPLLFEDGFDLVSKLQETATLRAAQKKSKVKKEDSSNLDDDSESSVGLIGFGEFNSEDESDEESDDALINRAPTFSIKTEGKPMSDVNISNASERKAAVKETNTSSRIGAKKTCADSDFSSDDESDDELLYGGPVFPTSSAKSGGKDGGLRGNKPGKSGSSPHSVNSDSSEDESDNELLYGKPMFPSSSAKSGREKWENSVNSNLSTKAASQHSSANAAVKTEPGLSSFLVFAAASASNAKPCCETEVMIDLLSSDEEEEEEDCVTSYTNQKAALENGLSQAIPAQDWANDSGTNPNHKRPIRGLTEDEQLQAAVRASMAEDAEGGGDDAEDIDYDETSNAADNTAEDESKPSMFESEIMAIEVGDEPTSGIVARVQIRMPGGKRLVRKFKGDSPVKFIYAFVAQSNEEAENGRRFELKAKFPPQDLFASIDDSISGCGLNGEAISVVWK